MRVWVWLAVFDRKKWASSACKKRIQRAGERQAA